MSTSSSLLTTSELDLLLSVNDSDLVSFLADMPMETAQSIITQMEDRKRTKTATGSLAAMPMRPTARQADFLNLDSREALYGGAAGGGKSEALLMWLAEGCGIPSYSGIIFRRTEDDLKNSNDSLIAKAMRMYAPLGAVMTDSGKKWRFRSGAMVELAGLHQEAAAVLKHQGPSYHRIAFDELTHFTQSQYEFLVLSRIRSGASFPIYKGARSSSNPGGPGHAWVKDRFITRDALDTLRGMDSDAKCPPGLVFHTPKGHAFVPARLADNPYINRDEYRAQMMQFSDPVMRERMLNGDWSVMPNCLIKPEWLKMTFIMHGDFIRFHNPAGDFFWQVRQNLCRRIVTMDTRGTSKEITKEAKGKPHSWTVIQVWDQIRGPQGKMFMALRYCDRKRQTYGDTKATLLAICKEWKPILVKVENRQVFLPRDEGTWKPTLEAEWLSWQGLEDETNDQVDAAAYAALDCGPGSGGSAVMPFDIRGGAMAAMGRR
jgi:hypothetical protein